VFTFDTLYHFDTVMTTTANDGSFYHLFVYIFDTRVS